VIIQEGLPGLRRWLAPECDVLAPARFAEVDDQFGCGAHQSGLSRLIFRISCRSFWTLVDARVGPQRLSRSRTTESLAMPANDGFHGLTTTKQGRQSLQALHNQAQRSRSAYVCLGRFTERRSTTS
jgi:hypothetical protein